MKTYLASITAMLLCVTLCSAQTSGQPKRNAVSLELGKTGLIYNLNLDHKLASKRFGFRIGAGSNLGRYLHAITVGGGGYHLIGRTAKFFELGLDLQYLMVDEVSDDQRGFASFSVYPNYSIKTIYPSLNIGYRRYGHSTLLRAGLSPGILKGELIPGGYISYGFTF
ncbi:MAG: hypothetical protein WKF91_15840 [Segetibacter sp.]